MPSGGPQRTSTRHHHGVARLFLALVIQIIRYDLASDFSPARDTWNHGSSQGGRPLHGLSDSQISSS